MRQPRISSHRVQAVQKLNFEMTVRGKDLAAKASEQAENQSSTDDGVAEPLCKNM